MKNKKAQIGETLTWIIATIAILIILGVSIFATNLLKGRKYEDIEFSKQADLLVMKSLSSYLLTEETQGNGKNVFDQLKEQGNLNEFNGNLAESIFKNFYQEKYPYLIWLGIYENGVLVKNEFFKKSSRILKDEERGIFERIYLDEDKDLRLILIEEYFVEE